jgi:hypothetical protein
MSIFSNVPQVFHNMDNIFSYSFISIKMARIIVGSSNLTQFLLLYPGLRPAMLDSMVMWYPRKILFATWNRCSRRMRILMKILVIELKPTD